MSDKILRILGRTAQLYAEKRIPRSAAALSYHLTMSLFPLIICLYTLLGKNYAKTMLIVDFVDQFLSAEVTRYLKSFLIYVANHHAPAMLTAGLILLLTSASAAARTLQMTIGELQGGRRYRGLGAILFSIVFSVVFVAAMYFAILVMLTGEDFLEFVDSFLPFLDISRSWRWLRFFVLAGIEYVIFFSVYEVSKKNGDSYKTSLGALLATVGMVVMSWIFSVFIAASARYPLVYGSLASLILLMFWLFLSCQVMIVGAALNVAIRDESGA